MWAVNIYQIKTLKKAALGTFLMIGFTLHTEGVGAVNLKQQSSTVIFKKRAAFFRKGKFVYKPFTI
jgi:hypothetical protein